MANPVLEKGWVKRLAEMPEAEREAIISRLSPKTQRYVRGRLKLMSPEKVRARVEGRKRTLEEIKRELAGLM